MHSKMKVVMPVSFNVGLCGDYRGGFSTTTRVSEVEGKACSASLEHLHET